MRGVAKVERKIHGEGGKGKQKWKGFEIEQDY
jgi:hypothetical protein